MVQFRLSFAKRSQEQILLEFDRLTGWKIKERNENGLNDIDTKLLELRNEKVIASASTLMKAIYATNSDMVRSCFDLNKQQFWDGIRMRYGWELPNLPATCGCGAR